MDIDVNQMRDHEIRLHGLNRADGAYTLYYDETNNYRLVRITEDGLNAPEAKCFVLGGIAHSGPPRELPFLALRESLRLQPSVRELKLVHLGKGDILKLLDSAKVGVFLKWLEQERLFLHYQALDPIYWSIVDIVDSIVAEAGQFQLTAMAWELKDALNTLTRANLSSVITLFRSCDYPNVGAANRPRFLDALIGLFEPRQRLLPDFHFRMLIGLLHLGKKLEALPFLNGEEPRLLIAHYRHFYAARLCILKHAHHILDVEDVVSRELATWRFMDGASQLQHFRFVASHDEIGIQISDPIVGLLGKLCAFAIEQDKEHLIDARQSLNGRQLTNLATMARLINRSIDENRVFANYVMAISDQRKLWAFLGEDTGWA